MKYIKYILTLLTLLTLTLLLTSCTLPQFPQLQQLNQKKLNEDFLMSEFPPSKPATPSTSSIKIQSDNLNNKDKQNNIDNFKGVWISYLEIEAYLKDKSKTEFTEEVTKIFERVCEKKLNSVIVQVRANSDTIYPSKHYPWSYHITSKAKALDYDPLAIMIEKAHTMGLNFHCWINPFRLMTDNRYEDISDKFLIKKWYDSNDKSNKSDYMKKGDNGFWYLNPANKDVVDLILNGVEEIITNYNVDGIHIDDYFYDQVSPEDFGQTEDDGRKNTTNLVKSMHDLIKSHDQNILFGVSPAGGFGDKPTSDITQLTDLSLWCSKDGYVDYIAPQVYWDFDGEIYPFDKTVDKWAEFMKNSTVRLYIGLANYKYDTDNIKKQIDYCSDLDKVSGYIHYRYDNI